jgi:ABC-type transport system involved in multi-copper enzyme maturation permease subunit
MIVLLRRSIAQARYMLIPSLILLWGFQLVLVAQAVMIQRTQGFGRMLELLPAFIQRGLGSKALVLASFKGTVVMGYYHPVPAFVLTLLAVYAASEPAHEIEAGLVDLVLARAVTRRAVLTRSLVLAVLYILVGTSVMALGTWMGLRLFAASADDGPSADLVVRLLAHLGGVAACFAGLGLLLASTSRRWSLAFATTALAGLSLYLLDFLALGWPALDAVSWMSPFYYDHALAIVAGDAPRYRNLVILFGAALSFSAAAYWRFQRRDL